MRAPSRSLMVALGLAAAPVVACSMGYRTVYEGNVRFEHCYRLDDEPAVALADKQRCWHEWLQHDTYGQTRDRAEYAEARERTLAQAAAAGEAKAPPGARKLGSLAGSPQPTNAFAPPPQTM